MNISRIQLISIFAFIFLTVVHATAQITNDQQALIDKYNEIAGTHLKNRNYDEAIVCFNKAIDLIPQAQRDMNKDYPILLGSISFSYYQKGDISLAIDFARRSSELRKKTGGEMNPSYASSMSFLGILYKSVHDFEKASDCYKTAASIQAAILGKDHENYASTINNLGLLQIESGDYKSAITNLSNAAKVFKDKMGENSYYYISAINNLGMSYSKMGNFESAVKYLSLALEIEKKASMDQSELYAATLNYLGMLYELKGEYIQALSYFEKSAGLNKKLFGENSINYASSLNNIAIIYSHRGLYSESARHYQRSMNILKNIDGGKSIQYASTCSSLGLVYSCLSDYSNALNMVNQAVAIHQESGDTESISYARNLNNLGMLYHTTGDYKNAEDYYNKALQVLKQIKGEKNIEYTNLLHNIGALYSQKGDYNKALTYYQLSFDKIKQMFGDNSSRNISNICSMALACFMLNKSSQALDYSIQLLNATRDNLKENLLYMTEYERIFYWNTLERNINIITALSLAESSSSEQFSAVIFNALLISKGLLLTTGTEIEKLILQSNDDVLANIFNELRYLNRNMDVAAQNGIPVTDSLKNIAAGYEKQILDKVRQISPFTKNLTLEWKDIQNNMSDNDVAIEFVNYKFNDQMMYSAVVLRKGWAIPKIVNLFYDTDNEFMLPGKEQTVIYNLVLNNLIWGKLEPYLHTGDTIYFAPAGGLYNIALEYLLINEKERMCDKYNMIRVSSTREIVLGRERKENINHTAALYGGLNYNTNISDMQLYAADYAVRGETSSRFTTTQDLRSTTWGYLTGTRQEVEQINPTLGNSKFTTCLYIGDEGVEEAFKALSGKKTGIIHIATHGFYVPDMENTSDKLITQGLNPLPKEDKSLLRSGLVFAGANNAWLGKAEIPEGIDDGILTAKEISLIDLQGTGLVVLSACQTGLGDITGEGVFGLQRAFKKAGVQTLLMSLWEVNDEATKIMMTAFYEALANGQSKREALHTAQEKIKQQTFIVDGQERSGSDPYFWAAFVMMD